ncbi:MAG: type II toxin-antitoxin system HicB family antitoxin [Rectinemataceae bacterium]
MVYLIIIEKTGTGYSACAPDLPGCIANSSNVVEARRLMREGIEFHIEGLRLEGYPVPLPSSEALFFAVADTGKVSGETVVETLYDIKTFAARMGVSPCGPDVITAERHPAEGAKEVIVKEKQGYLGKDWQGEGREAPRGSRPGSPAAKGQSVPRALFQQGESGTHRLLPVRCSGPSARN